MCIYLCTYLAKRRVRKIPNVSKANLNYFWKNFEFLAEAGLMEASDLYDFLIIMHNNDATFRK